ncbi:MAG: S8 family serine peptidase, partial [Clostridium sp.]
MFFTKNKIDSNLMALIKENSYKKYRVLIKCKNFQHATVKKVSSYKGSLINSIEFSHIITALLDARGIDRISEYPEVEKIVLDEFLFLCGMSVRTANKVYNYSKASFSGKGVCVGLVDSGIFPHPDLMQPSSRVCGFVDLLNGLTHPYDDNGHGTAMAGIICGSGISSNEMYRGIAPHSTIYCYKAFDKLGKGYASDILFSIENLIKLSSEHNIKILCLPFEQLSY